MQVVEAIELTEGTTPICIATNRGIKVMIIGVGHISTVFSMEIPEPLTAVMDEVISADMDFEIRNEILRRRADANQLMGEPISIMEFTCNNIYLDIQLENAAKLLDTSNRISNHPQWMNNQCMKYKAPDRRCEVVRRGKRQIRTPSA